MNTSKIKELRKMDDDLKPISFRASAEEVDTMDRAARENGLSRAEYIRQRLATQEGQSSSAMGNSQPSKDLTALLEHIVYGLHCVHSALYAIAETSGAITAAQANQIAEGSIKGSHKYLAQLGERIAATRQQIKSVERASQLNTEAPEIKDHAVSRSV